MLLYFSVTNVSTANPLKGVSKYFLRKSIIFTSKFKKQIEQRVLIFIYDFNSLTFYSFMNFQESLL